jgi:hypothetical protein
MFEKIKTITDEGEFKNIFYKFFIDHDAFLNLKDGKIKVRFFGYTSGQAAFRISQMKNVPDECLIITKMNNSMIYAYLRFIEKQEDNIFIFAPTKFQIITSSRGEDRSSLDVDAGGKHLVFVANIISDFIIENTLVQRIKKIDRIREQVSDEMENAFDYIRVYLRNEGTADPRMKYFLSEKTPIFIPDLSKKKSGSGDTFFKFYIDNIHSRDHQLQKRKEIISEISVPFLYQSKMPYGYLQVNGKTPFAKETLSSVKKFSVYIDEQFRANEIFSKSSEKFIVNSLSKSGFGIVFKERKYIRYFKKDSMVYLDMILPGNKRASILVMVKHISVLPNKTITIGFEISEIDALGEVNYDEFVASIQD